MKKSWILTMTETRLVTVGRFNYEPAYREAGAAEWTWEEPPCCSEPK